MDIVESSIIFVDRKKILPLIHKDNFNTYLIRMTGWFRVDEEYFFKQENILKYIFQYITPHQGFFIPLKYGNYAGYICQQILIGKIVFKFDETRLLYQNRCILDNKKTLEENIINNNIKCWIFKFLQSEV